MIKKRLHPTLCITHNCNLNCVYCYQKHDKSEMSIETAKKCIDKIFSNIPHDYDDIEISFIGGEPLLKFDIIKEIFEYTNIKYNNYKYIFFASTNGTILTNEMREWFTKRKEKFVLGLSFDGIPAVQNFNRSNSFDMIDINYFINNWPKQGVKMTLSEYSLKYLSKSIIYLHSLGIKNIIGVNLFEGDFDWNNEEFIKILFPQLKELVNFYVENDELHLNQMFNKKIEVLSLDKRIKQKYCGIGSGVNFFDVDGTIRPCAFCTPMTFDNKTLSEIEKTDFFNPDNFIDDDCFANCYLQPICSSCSGNNYLKNNSFKKFDKTKCRIQKLIALFTADLLVKRILKNPFKFTNSYKLQILKSSKKIKELYLTEFINYYK